MVGRVGVLVWVFSSVLVSLRNDKGDDLEAQNNRAIAEP